MSESRLIQSFVSGLKTHIQVELELHDITSVELARQKAKAAKKKFERLSWSKPKRVYSRRRFPQSTNVDNIKYVPPHLREGDKSNMEIQRMREGKCKRCGEKWDPKHRCANGKEKNLYNCEATNDSNNDDSDVEGMEDTPEFSPEVDDESILQV